MFYDFVLDFEQKALKDKVENYLKSLDKIALTFTLNQLRGTPSFVIFNSDYEIIKQWFGHVSYEDLNSKLEQFI